MLSNTHTFSVMGKRGGMDSFPSIAMLVWSVWKVALGWPYDGLCIVYCEMCVQVLNLYVELLIWGIQFITPDVLMPKIRDFFFFKQPEN